MSVNLSVYGKIREFLTCEGIEYMEALDFSECEIINPRKLHDFSPKSAVVFLIPYYTGQHPERNVSLYSVSRDYHMFASTLSSRLSQLFDGDKHTFRLFCDSSPINERSLALKAGLGVMGENRLIINEKYGSYVFIACILTDAVFLEDEYTHQGKVKKCISCGRCKKECAFLRGERDTCLSDLNQRKKVTEDELRLIQSQKIRWGCDTCQDICPMNSKAQITPIEFFHNSIIENITPELINSLSDEEFSQRAYSWRGKDTIIRNISDKAE